MRKVYVCVNADFCTEGKIIPNSFVWEDGRTYEIDRVLNIQKAASLKVGGIGDKYTVRVMGKETFIWLENEDNKWFVEEKI